MLECAVVLRSCFSTQIRGGLQREWRRGISNAGQKFKASNASHRRKIRSSSYVTEHVDDCPPEISEIGHAELEIDKESKTVMTAAGPLPISPLMDEAYLAARQKWQQPKPPALPQHEKTKFQRQLERNAFAQMLGSKGRYCAATTVRLPSDFLQSFELVENPQTGAPWWVPNDLAPSHPPPAPAGEGGKESPSLSPPPTASPPVPLSQPPRQPVPSAPHHDTAPTDRHNYTLSRQDLLDAMGDKTSPYRSGHRRFRLESAVRHMPGSMMARSIWREDMGSRVLELMRRRAVEDLLYLARLCDGSQTAAGAGGRGYLTPCASWDEARAVRHRGCVLYLGGGGSGEGEEGGGDGVPALSDIGTGSDTELADPATNKPFTTLDVKSIHTAMVPVHNLAVLLGTEHLARLRRSSSIFRSAPILSLGRRRTVPLQVKLWKLQGYLLGEEATQQQSAVEGEAKGKEKREDGKGPIRQTVREKKGEGGREKGGSEPKERGVRGASF